MSNRIARVRELLKREISTCIERDFDFPGKLVSIHDVDVTPDFKKAHIFLGVIGGDIGEVVRKLNKKRGQIQNTVNKRVVLKYTPTYEFHGTDSIERGVHVMSVLDDLVAQSPHIAEPDPVEKPTPDDSTSES